MPRACRGRVLDQGGRAGGARVESLRRAYFAQAGELAIRYGIVFDRVIEHVRDAEESQPQRGAYSIRYVEDLVHAVACVEGRDVAWRDLVEQHERALLRSCLDPADPAQAIVLVRRFGARLRRETQSPLPQTDCSLRAYTGTRSMRRWLRDRLLSWARTTGGPPRLVLVAPAGPAEPMGPVAPPAVTAATWAIYGATPATW